MHLEYNMNQGLNKKHIMWGKKSLAVSYNGVSHRRPF